MTYDTGFQTSCPECGFLTDNYQIRCFGRCKDCQDKDSEKRKHIMINGIVSSNITKKKTFLSILTNWLDGNYKL